MADSEILRVEKFRLKAAQPQPDAIPLAPTPLQTTESKPTRRGRKLPDVARDVNPKFDSNSVPVTLMARSELEAITDSASRRIQIFRDTPLTAAADAVATAAVCEPSVAMNDRVVIHAGSTYAAISSDSGRTFSYLDPITVFKGQTPPALQCSSDQVVNYIPQKDTFVWVLHYGPAIPPRRPGNFERLALATTGEVPQGRWRVFDITAEGLGVSRLYLDFPDVTVGRNFVYLTIDLYSGDPPSEPAGAALIRIPIDQIDKEEIEAERALIFDEEVQSYRCAQNIDDTAYFAAHQSDSAMRIFEWSETGPGPVKKLAAVSTWKGIQKDEPYSSICKDGNDWLHRIDPRITGATKRGNELWFAWTVDKDTAGPHPCIQIAVVDADTYEAKNFHVKDPQSATAYPALATNAIGDVGITYFIGGGPRNPSHVVGLLADGRVEGVLISEGERGPDNNDPGSGWGDCICIRPAFPDRRKFAATGYTMLGAPRDPGRPNQDSTPRFVLFGRPDQQ